MAESYSQVASKNRPPQPELAPDPTTTGGTIPSEDKVPVSIDGKKVADVEERIEEFNTEDSSPTRDDDSDSKKPGKEGRKKGGHKGGHCHNKALYRSVVGFGNIALVASLGFAAYQNWNKPWDRRVVGGIAIGLGAIFGAEGYFGALKYKERKGHHHHDHHHDHHHKHHKKH